MTKIVVGLFIIVLALHLTAAILTYACVSSDRFFEGNPSTAVLQTDFGLIGGLTLTLIEGTVLSMLPLTMYLAMSKFTFSNRVTPIEKEQLTRWLKFFSFPLAAIALTYLALIAGFDVTHDLIMFVTNGKIDTWTFHVALINR